MLSSTAGKKPGLPPGRKPSLTPSPTPGDKPATPEKKSVTVVDPPEKKSVTVVDPVAKPEKTEMSKPTEAPAPAVIKREKSADFDEKAARRVRESTLH